MRWLTEECYWSRFEKSHVTHFAVLIGYRSIQMCPVCLSVQCNYFFSVWNWTKHRYNLHVLLRAMSQVSLLWFVVGYVSLLWFVVGLFNCIQRPSSQWLLKTPLGNQKWTKGSRLNRIRKLVWHSSLAKLHTCTELRNNTIGWVISSTAQHTVHGHDYTNAHLKDGSIILVHPE